MSIRLEDKYEGKETYAEEDMEEMEDMAAFEEMENAIKRDPNNVEVLILKGKLLWSMDKVDEGNEMFW